MKTDLLWVYEGLDDYNADLLVTRSGFWTPDQTRNYWAMEAAQLDREAGGRGARCRTRPTPFQFHDLGIQRCMAVYSQ